MIDVLGRFSAKGKRGNLLSLRGVCCAREEITCSELRFRKVSERPLVVDRRGAVRVRRARCGWRGLEISGDLARRGEGGAGPRESETRE